MCLLCAFTKREGVVGDGRLASQVAENVLRIAIACAPFQVRSAQQTDLLQFVRLLKTYLVKTLEVSLVSKQTDLLEFCPIIENLLGENSGGESGEH